MRDVPLAEHEHGLTGNVLEYQADHPLLDALGPEIGPIDQDPLTFTFIFQEIAAVIPVSNQGILVHLVMVPIRGGLDGPAIHQQAYPGSPTVPAMIFIPVSCTENIHSRFHICNDIHPKRTTFHTCTALNTIRGILFLSQVIVNDAAG